MSSFLFLVGFYFRKVGIYKKPLVCFGVAYAANNDTAEGFEGNE